MLGFFKGRLLKDFPAYSMGTRQSTAQYAADHDWWGKHRVFVGEGQPEGEQRSYSDWLSSSIFCMAFRGEVQQRRRGAAERVRAHQARPRQHS